MPDIRRQREAFDRDPAHGSRRAARFQLQGLGRARAEQHRSRARGRHPQPAYDDRRRPALSRSRTPRATGRQGVLRRSGPNDVGVVPFSRCCASRARNRGSRWRLHEHEPGIAAKAARPREAHGWPADIRRLLGLGAGSARGRDRARRLDACAGQSRDDLQRKARAPLAWPAGRRGGRDGPPTHSLSRAAATRQRYGAVCRLWSLASNFVGGPLQDFRNTPLFLVTAA